MNNTKWCPHCQAEKPLTDFYTDRSTASGFDAYCKGYRKEKQRARARQTRENRRARRIAAGEKVDARFRTDLRIDDIGRQCSECEVFKQWDDFYIDTKSRSGHVSKCIACTTVRRLVTANTLEGRAAARRRTAEYRERKRGPGWTPSQVPRHADLDCDGQQHQCTGPCGQMRPVADFPINKATPCGFDPRCKQCRHERRVERRSTNHNNIRLREALITSLRRCGLTIADYDWLLALQGGGCYLCGEPESQGDNYWLGKKRLAVDHDHGHCPPMKSCKTCIRGLLCHNCNVGLGMFEGKAATRGLFADYLLRRPFMTN